MLVIALLGFIDGLSFAATYNFNYHQMIKNLLRGVTKFVRPQCIQMPKYHCFAQLTQRPSFYFCDKKSESNLAISEAPQVKVSTAKIGEEEVELVQTKGSISIMDRVPGVKADNGELYVLSFTCTKCDTKSIRSFTKHAYHKGVVLVRCGGCENIHLVADNIGWFEDKPTNVETMH